MVNENTKLTSLMIVILFPVWLKTKKKETMKSELACLCSNYITQLYCIKGDGGEGFKKGMDC